MQALVLPYSNQFRTKLAGKNLLNIQMDHIPINLQMSGSSEGNMRLKDKAPPSNIETYPWTPKTLYKTVPGTAGFFVAVEALGANVAAVFWATCHIKNTNIKITIHSHSPTCKLQNFQESMDFDELGILKICLKLKLNNDPNVGT